MKQAIWGLEPWIQSRNGRLQLYKFKWGCTLYVMNEAGWASPLAGLCWNRIIHNCSFII